jgi:hypothetical protein
VYGVEAWQGFVDVITGIVVDVPQVARIANLVARQSIVNVYRPAIIVVILLIQYGTIARSVVERVIDRYGHCVKEISSPSAHEDHAQ